MLRVPREDGENATTNTKPPTWCVTLPGMNEELESTEEWRWIIDRYGEQSGYQVSSMGRVRTRHTRCDGLILKGGEGPDSQDPKKRKVWLTDVLHPQSRPHSVEKLVAATFHERPRPGAKIQWINGCVWDNRAENVRWVYTDKEWEPVASDGYTVDQLRTRLKTAETAVRDALKEMWDAQIALTKGLAQIEAEKG